MRGALGFALTAALMAGGLVGGRMMMRPTFAAGEPATASSASFDTLMAESMARMHADMTVPPSGDPDRDFAAMMIPHHAGAIAKASCSTARTRSCAASRRGSSSSRDRRSR